MLVLEYCDTKLVADSLNANLTHAGDGQIVALDSGNSLLLQGPAPWVAEFAHIVLEVNERERVLAAPLGQ